MSYQLQILDMVKTFFRCKGKAHESCVDPVLLPGIYKDFKNPLSKTKTYIGECIMYMYGAVKNDLTYKTIIRKL